MGDLIKAIVSRSRAPGDDGPPPPAEVALPSGATLEDALAHVWASGVLPAEENWLIISRRPLAVASSRWALPKIVAANLSDPAELLLKDGAVRLHCHLSHEDPDEAFRRLEAFDHPAAPARLVRVLEQHGCSNLYYDICDRHPMRGSAPRERMALRDVVARAKSVLALKPLRGPGHVLLAEDMPQDFELTFVLRSGTVEARLWGPSPHHRLGAFRSLFRDAKELAWDNEPDRLYRDPSACTMDELIAILLELKALSVSMAEILTGADCKSFKPALSEANASRSASAQTLNNPLRNDT